MFRVPGRAEDPRRRHQAAAARGDARASCPRRRARGSRRPAGTRPPTSGSRAPAASCVLELRRVAGASAARGIYDVAEVRRLIDEHDEIVASGRAAREPHDVPLAARQPRAVAALADDSDDRRGRPGADDVARACPGKVLRAARRPADCSQLAARARSALRRGRTRSWWRRPTTPSDDPIAAFCAATRRRRAPRRRSTTSPRACSRPPTRIGLDAFVRVSGDSPLLDQRARRPRRSTLYGEGGADLVTNVRPSARSRPGSRVEVVDARRARAARCELMTEPGDREHVTPATSTATPSAFRIAQLRARAPDECALDASIDTGGRARALEAILARMDRPHWEYGWRRGARRSYASGVTVRVGVIGLGVGEQHVEAYARAPRRARSSRSATSTSAPGARSAARHPDARRDDRRRRRCSTTRTSTSSRSRPTTRTTSSRSARRSSTASTCSSRSRCARPRSRRARSRALLRRQPGLRLSSNLPLRRSPRFRALRERIARRPLRPLFYLEGDYDYGRLWKLTEGWRGDLERYSVDARRRRPPDRPAAVADRRRVVRGARRRATGSPPRARKFRSRRPRGRAAASSRTA